MSATKDKRSLESLDDIYREAIRTPEPEDRRPAKDLSEDFLGGDVYSADGSADGSFGQVVMHALAAHDPGWHGKEVAIAADKMRVTVKVRGGQPISTYQLHHGLEQLGVSHGIDWQALALVEKHSQSHVPGEVVVASGNPAEARRRVIFPEVERGFDLDGTCFWLVAGVKLDGAGVRALLTAETLFAVEQDPVIVKAVAAGTVIAKIHQNPEAKAGMNVMGEIIDPADDLVPERGDHVLHSEQQGSYETSLYGYLVLEGNTMSVLPPIWLSPDHLGAYYVNCTQLGTPLYPAAHDLIDTLRRLGVREATIRQGLIDKLSARLAQGQLLPARTVKIAEAIAPRPGRHAGYAFAVDVGEKAETIGEDGTIDLSERNAVVMVKAGALIAVKTLATKGIPGADLFGTVIEAADGRDLVISFDQSFRAEERDGQIHYFARKDGNIRFAGTTLTIADLHVVTGNVDSTTGNLDRPEDVLINGSVMAGHTVRSQGNISVAGSVYHGAKVLAGGDVTIGEGIIGAETRVVALGHLQAVFIQEAEVIVKGRALVRSYLYKAVLRANGTITVVNTPVHGHKSGRIIGGMTCSSRAVVVSRAGHADHPGTLLAILPDPELSGQLKRLEEEGRNCRESISRISRSLPFENFDAAVIKRVLAQMPVDKREPVIKLLTTFNTLIKRQQNIDTLRKEVNARMQSDLRNGTIRIMQGICQGSEVQFGDKKLVVSADLEVTTFSLQGGEIV